jgi:type VI secretion system protein VasI
MKKLLVILISVLSLNIFTDISSHENARCVAIKSDLERLACFDSLAEEKNLNGMQSLPTVISDKGKWNVEENTDPIDDSKTVFLSLEADSGTTAFGKPIYLFVRCINQETDMLIAWSRVLGDEGTSVLTRLGKGEATRINWTLSATERETFYPDNVELFLKKLIEVETLVHQITPYRSGPITAVFDVRGLVNAIKPIRSTCSW